MAPEPTETLVERAAHRIRREILTGELPPAARLRVQELARRYAIGATPIREALSRLSIYGLVEAIGNRGFHVPGLSRDDLADITRTRQMVEAEALRRAIERGDDEWEANIAAALHRLRKAAARPSSREGDEEFDRAHKGFHRALIAACGSPRLLELHGLLYDQAFRYRLIMMRKVRRTPDFGDEHARLADTVMNRRLPAAGAHLARHLESTLDAVYPKAQNPRQNRGRKA